MTKSIKQRRKTTNESVAIHYTVCKILVELNDVLGNQDLQDDVHDNGMGIKELRADVSAIQLIIKRAVQRFNAEQAKLKQIKADEEKRLADAKARLEASGYKVMKDETTEKD